MASKTDEFGGVKQWPTPERFAEAKRSLVDAFTALENLTFDYQVLNGEFDPCDIAAESRPVTSEAIAAVVEFLMETEFDVERIAEIREEISGWPSLMAHTRAEQRVQARTEVSVDA